MNSISYMVGRIIVIRFDVNTRRFSVSCEIVLNIQLDALENSLVQ